MTNVATPKAVTNNVINPNLQRDENAAPSGCVNSAVLKLRQSSAVVIKEKHDGISESNTNSNLTDKCQIENQEIRNTLEELEILLRSQNEICQETFRRLCNVTCREIVLTQSKKDSDDSNMVMIYANLIGKLTKCLGSDHAFVIKLQSEQTTIEKNNEHLLYEASKAHNIELVKRLINTCVCVSCYKDKDGWTALLQSCVSNITSLVEILLKAGADPNERNKRNDTPMFWAVRNDNVDMVQVLIKYGARLTHNTTGITALHMAAEMGSLSTVKYFVTTGIIKINTVDKKYNTPLRAAKISKKLEVVQYLQYMGAKDHLYFL